MHIENSKNTIDQRILRVIFHEGCRKGEEIQLAVLKEHSVHKFGRSRKFTQKQGVCFPNDLDVSSKHAELYIDKNSKLTVMDLKSTNGTYINGKKILPEHKYPIHSNDMIRIGKSKLNIVLDTKNRSLQHDILKLSESTVRSNVNEFANIAQEDSKDFVDLTEDSKDDIEQNCTMCDKSIESLSLLERQVHLNMCLDQSSEAGKTSEVEMQSKKLKKNTFRGFSRPKTVDQEQLQLAMVMSASLTEPTEKNVNLKGCKKQNNINQIIPLEVDVFQIQTELDTLTYELDLIHTKREKLKRKLKSMKRKREQVSKDELTTQRDETHNLISLTPMDKEETLNMLYPPQNGISKEMVKIKEKSSIFKSQILLKYMSNRKVKRSNLWKQSTTNFDSVDSCNSKTQDLSNVSTNTTDIHSQECHTSSSDDGKTVIESSSTEPLNVLREAFEDETQENYRIMINNKLDMETYLRVWKMKAPSLIDLTFPNWAENLEYLHSAFEEAQVSEEARTRFFRALEKIIQLRRDWNGRDKSSFSLSKLEEIIALMYFERIMKWLSTTETMVFLPNDIKQRYDSYKNLFYQNSNIKRMFSDIVFYIQESFPPSIGDRIGSDTLVLFEHMKQLIDMMHAFISCQIRDSTDNNIALELCLKSLMETNISFNHKMNDCKENVNENANSSELLFSNSPDHQEKENIIMVNQLNH